VTDTSDKHPLLICVLGPESTGKTQLATDLAEALGCPFVPEYVRDYAAKRSTPFGRWDDDEYVEIALGQAEWIADAISHDSDFVVTDTDPFTVWVWHRHYTGEPLPKLAHVAEERADLYVIPSLEVPFIPDGIRELVLPREEVREIYVGELVRTRRRYLEVSGTRLERVEQVMDELDRMAQLSP